jgi:hypothetical protein
MTMTIRVRFDANFIKTYPTPEKLTRIYDEAQPGLVVQITPMGAKSFVAVYYVKGVEGRMFLGDATAMSCKEARRLTAKCREMARKGIDPRGGRRPAEVRRGGVKLQEVFSKYLEYCSEVRGHLPEEHEDFLGEKSLGNLRCTIRGLIVEFGDREWAEVTDEVLLKWHYDQRKTPAKANAYIREFKAAWQWARNPQPRILPREAPSMLVLLEAYKPHPGRAHTRNLSDAEIVKLAAAMRDFRGLFV